MQRNENINMHAEEHNSQTGQASWKIHTTSLHWSADKHGCWDYPWYGDVSWSHWLVHLPISILSEAYWRRESSSGIPSVLSSPEITVMHAFNDDEVSREIVGTFSFNVHHIEETLQCRYEKTVARGLSRNAKFGQQIDGLPKFELNWRLRFDTRNTS